jgi:hypothetical protein
MARSPTALGQGVPGGIQSLPPLGAVNPAVGTGAPLGAVNPGVGGLGGPPIGVVNPGATVPSQQRVPALTDNNLANRAIPALKAHDLATAVTILDQIAAGQISVAEAKPALSTGFTSKERDFLVQYATKKFGPRAVDPLRALGTKPDSGGGGFMGFINKANSVMATALAGPLQLLPGGHGESGAQHIPANLAADVKNTITGTPASVAVLGKSIYHDATSSPLGLIEHPGKSEVLSKIVGPTAKGIWHDLGPLVEGTGAVLTGDLGGAVKEYQTFGHRFTAHPLGPITDALSVATVGAGSVARSAVALRAIRATEVTRGATGLAEVGVKAGLNVKVEPMANGMWRIRDRGKIARRGFPTEDAAIAHAQTMATGGVNPIALEDNLKAAKAGEISAKAPVLFGIKAGLKRPTNPMMLAYNKAKAATIIKENDLIATEVATVLGDPQLVTGRLGFKGSMAQVAADIAATKETRSKARATSPVIGPTMAGLQEITEAVRAGAIYLRPGYLPNNWAGNSFMQVIDQGAWAPLNLGKAVFAVNKMDPRNLAAMRAAMGRTATQAIAPASGRGYIAAVMSPIARGMGNLADTPFRDATMIHALRRKGYKTIDQIDRLFNEARLHGQTTSGDKAITEIADSARLAQEEIVRFGKYSDTERETLRNVIFIYAWMKGSGRYALRFPFAHPIVSAAAANTQQIGNQWLKEEMGGVPSFLVGAIPVGRDSKGNPLLINPFSLNPLGTGLDIAKAAIGTYKSFVGDPTFDRYADTTWVDLANPLIKASIGAIYEGRSGVDATLKTIALYNTIHGLTHPGGGSIYPTTRAEAAGKFTFGSLYPRTADQMAIERSLVREHIGNPAALIPYQIKQFEKISGQKMDPKFVDAYRADLKAAEKISLYQHNYAHDHGSSGFRNLPAQNRAEAALAYLEEEKLIPPDQVRQVEIAMSNFKTDAEYNDLASALWGSTGVGQVKRQWDDLVRQIKGQGLSRARK